MTIAYWCVLAAGLLPYSATLCAKLGARFDNNNPRQWLAQQTGWRARANAAQQNAFEAFPLFAIAVLVAHQQDAPQARVDLLAEIFVAARVAYLLAYLADQALVRTLVWLAGIAAAVMIFTSGT